ncbi:MAG TPA: zinc ABC transporter substrate-binding protein [Anaerolineales bacterium]|nr:zinc ABC transporter substrate-binding protein [Anaerolineales bacterium]
MRLLWRGIAGGIFAACLLLAGCQPAPSRPAGMPTVLAAETFLGDIAQNVAGDRLKVETLLPVTVDPHEFQPKPQDVVKLAQCQVLIVNGLGYESWLQKTIEGIGGQRLEIVATAGLTPNPDPSGAHPEGDPHMWMDPLNTIHYVEQIRNGLSQADPAGAAAYAANAAAYIAKLQALDQWIRNRVAEVPVEKRLLVTNHDALAYFGRAYQFTIVGAVIPSITTDASPSAQQLAALIDTIRKTGAPVVFLDVGENQKLADQIAAETGVKVVADLYVESISGPGGPAPTYIDMIEHDVLVIVGALK